MYILKKKKKNLVKFCKISLSVNLLRPLKISMHQYPSSLSSILKPTCSLLFVPKKEINHIDAQRFWGAIVYRELCKSIAPLKNLYASICF